MLTETVRAVGLDRALSAALAPWRLPNAVHGPAKVLLEPGDDACGVPEVGRAHYPRRGSGGPWMRLVVAVRTAGTGRRHTALTHRLQAPSATRP